jgi:predicted phosphodiesterase
LKTFKEKKVDHIICLGDVLNTREMVSVQALSSAMKFFDELTSISNV